MNELQAYPCGRSWTDRVLTTYKPGDVVIVGPAYQMGGGYSLDSYQGRYRVLSRIGNSSDYKLTHMYSSRDEWDVIISASRLTLEGERCRGCGEQQAQQYCEACERFDLSIAPLPVGWR